MRRIFLFFGSLLLYLGLFCSPSWAEDYLFDSGPAPSSAHEQPDPLERGFQDKLDRLLRPSLWRESLERLPPFFRDSSLRLNVRNYYLTRNSLDNNNKEAWALGGSLEYLSGKLFDIASFGAGVFTSQKLSGADSRDGTVLLRSGQKSYTTLGTLYAKLNYRDHELSLFRQKYDLPFVNAQDSRMTPNTFEGYSLSAKSALNPNFQYILGYINKIKERNSTSFDYMSEAAGAAGSKRGTIMSGGRYDLQDRLSIGAINFYTSDTINVLYTQSDFEGTLHDEIEFKLSLQFTDQSTVGDDLISGESYSTQAYGTRMAASYKNAILSTAFTSSSKTNSLISPWGSYAGFNSMIINDFNRAGENTWRIGLSYDFKEYLDGLSFFANYLRGNAAVDNQTGESLPDNQEVDVTVDYRFKEGYLKDLWIRLRAALVHEDGGSTLEDYRVIINQPLDIF